MLDHNAFQLKIIQLSIPKRLAFKEVVDILVHFSIFPVYKKWSREMKPEGRETGYWKGSNNRIFGLLYSRLSEKEG